MSKRDSQKPFETAYASLNAAQKQAVDAIEGPVMVIAGPGTGKTTILTLRIANILRLTDTPPSGILAITYTDAGVKAMRKKLENIIGARAHEVAIHTFHSFAAAMMAEYPDHFLSTADTRTISDVEQESLLREIIAKPVYKTLRPSGRPDAYISAIVKTIDSAKRDALLPEDVAKFARAEMKRLESDEASFSTRGKTKGELKASVKEQLQKCERTLLFADVYAEYEERKREAKLMDFNDLIIEFLAALKNDELLLRLIQERFLYILVDEHQDTNDAQNFIVEMLSDFFDTPNVFIVGDEKQAIYRFQGASVENFLALQKRWPKMKAISLSQNYRSHQDILDAAFAMVEHNYEEGEHKELRVPLLAERAKKRRPIDIVTAENAAAMENYLVEEIQKLEKNEPEATIAIITRRNRELERVLRILESANVAVSSERSVDIFTHPIGAAFFDILEYLADPTRTDALSLALLLGLFDLSLEDAARCIKNLRSGQTFDLEKELPGLARIRAELSGDGAVGFITNIFRHAGFEKLAGKDPAGLSVWRGVVALSEAIVRDRAISSPLSLIDALLAYRRSSELKTVKVAIGAPDMKLTAQTAHGSKGLEFDYVFLPYATEEAWIGKARGASFVLPERMASGSDIRDTRRLFYVALTRARKHATILVPQEESDGRSYSPLRFIPELASKSVREMRLPRADADLLEKGKTANGRESRKVLTAMGKERLLNSGLSVTALNHFLEDPKIFLTESVLRLPQAPSVSAEKGNAMHSAMESVWRAGTHDESKITSLIVEAVNTHLEKSFLPTGDKESIREELVEAAPQVATSLREHFSQNKSAVFTEYSCQTEFTTKVEGESVDILLRGKLDAVIENGERVSVFDYKTRQAMSEAAVRGETKGSAGNYFRQLVFYTLLLRGHPKWKNKSISTSLVFLSPDKKGNCKTLTLPVSEGDIKQLQSEIESLVKYVWKGELETLL